MRSHTDITNFLQRLKETHARPIVRQLQHYLHNADQMQLRQSCKDWQTILAHHTYVPYTSKQSFLLAMSRLFSEQAHFDMAWTLYQRTLNSSSQKAAAFFKQKDWARLFKSGKINDFAQDEHLANTGRLYCPLDAHVWPVNQVWLLAQYHKQRPIVILSELNEEVKLSNQPLKYSAFACEVAVTFQAGYRIAAVNAYDVTLHPPVPQPSPVSLTALRLDVQAIETSIKQVNQAIQQHFTALQCAQRVVDQWEKLKHCQRAALESLYVALKTQSTYWDTMFDGSVDNALSCQALTKLLAQHGITVKEKDMTSVKTMLTQLFIEKIDKYLSEQPVLTAPNVPLTWRC